MSKIHGLSNLTSQSLAMPKESLLEIGKYEKSLTIGIPREISFQENRIPLVPDSVSVLVSNGHEIVIETNAGKSANFEDKDFSECGARIVYSTNEIYQSDIVLKVAPPTFEE